MHENIHGNFAGLIMREWPCRIYKLILQYLEKLWIISDETQYYPISLNSVSLKKLHFNTSCQLECVDTITEYKK